jgi:ribonuclease PH
LPGIKKPLSFEYVISDLNHIEDSAGGPDVTVGIISKIDKVTLLQVTK